MVHLRSHRWGGSAFGYVRGNGGVGARNTKPSHYGSVSARIRDAAGGGELGGHRDPPAAVT